MKTPEILMDIRVKNNRILEKARELWGKDITAAEISRRTGVSQQILGRYINFKIAPLKKQNVDRDGLYSLEVDGCPGWYWTRDAVRLSLCFECSPEYLFPEDLREKRRNAYEVKLTLNQMKSLFIGNVGEIGDESAKRLCRKLLVKLTPREEQVIRMRWGLDDKEGMTLAEVGEVLEVSGERVRGIETKGMRKLRKAARKYE